MNEPIIGRRTVGECLPPNSRFVGVGTRWENPHSIEQKYGGGKWEVWDFRRKHYFDSEEEALEKSMLLFRIYAERRIRWDNGWLEPLRGKNLFCYCSLDEPCHRGILLELANR